LRDFGGVRPPAGCRRGTGRSGAPGALARIEAPRAGLTWGGSAGYLAHRNSRALRPDDAFRAASVTKNVTAAVTVQLAHQGRLVLDEPLADQLARELLHRWRALDVLPRTTPRARQLLAHTSSLPNYFTDEVFAARLREEPGRTWRPAELVDHAAAYGTPHFPPGRGFSTPTLATWSPESSWSRRPADRSTRFIACSSSTRSGRTRPGGKVTSLRGHRKRHTITRASSIGQRSPDDRLGRRWARHDRARPVALRACALVGTAPRLSRVLGELKRWTPAASFPPGHALRYERYGLGTGTNTVEGVELLGHTGFIGAFAFHAPEYDAVLAGTHNASHVDRWPLVAALCRELREAA
jgi:CubicO group peptidase (beta-lactamase class C family)